MSLNVTITHNGQTFNCSPREAASIEALMETNGGGFATIHDYVTSTGEVADINFMSRFSTLKLYERRIAALKEVSFSQVADALAGNAKLEAVAIGKAKEIFEERRNKLIESCTKTLDGDRSDAHRQAHDANYHNLAPGVKVHFVTEKNSDGVKRPVLDSKGNPTVDSIMLTIIQISKNVKVPGEYKVVNSGLPVLIGEQIEKLLPKTVKIKTLSLKEDKFSSLNIGKVEMLPEAFRGL